MMDNEGKAVARSLSSRILLEHVVQYIANVDIGYQIFYPSDHESLEIHSFISR